MKAATGIRWLLPAGWALAAAGSYGPWVAHKTAALTLSGTDLGEFVKFLPDGAVVRQLFYLPPLAVVIGVALLACSRQMGYPRPLRLLLLALAIPLSLQLLPPAWSPASLITAEFRPQTMALLGCWLLLATSWPLGRLPARPAGLVSALLSLAAGGLAAWQFLAVKPAIDRLYGTPPPIGWGFYLCLIGLAAVAGAGTALAAKASRP